MFMESRNGVLTALANLYFRFVIRFSNYPYRWHRLCDLDPPDAALVSEELAAFKCESLCCMEGGFVLPLRLYIDDLQEEQQGLHLERIVRT